MSNSLTLECEVHFRKRAKGRKVVQEGQEQGPACEPGRVPRVAKLMALAIKFQRMIEQGTVKDYAQMARLGRVSRARLTQIMNLTLLAPSVQEEILFLPRIEQGKDVLSLRQLQRVALEVDWGKQRRAWRGLGKDRLG